MKLHDYCHDIELHLDIISKDIEALKQKRDSLNKKSIEAYKKKLYI